MLGDNGLFTLNGTDRMGLLPGSRRGFGALAQSGAGAD